VVPKPESCLQCRRWSTSIEFGDCGGTKFGCMLGARPALVVRARSEGLLTSIPAMKWKRFPWRVKQCIVLRKNYPDRAAFRVTRPQLTLLSPLLTFRLTFNSPSHRRSHLCALQSFCATSSQTRSQNLQHSVEYLLDPCESAFGCRFPPSEPLDLFSSHRVEFRIPNLLRPSGGECPRVL
jgi:hypothetical protein